MPTRETSDNHVTDVALGKESQWPPPHGTVWKSKSSGYVYMSVESASDPEGDTSTLCLLDGTYHNGWGVQTNYEWVQSFKWAYKEESE